MSYSLSRTKELEALKDLKSKDKQSLIQLFLVIESSEDYSRHQKEYHKKLINKVLRDNFGTELSSLD
jgi:uncharacterized protein (UPF0216 family)